MRTSPDVNVPVASASTAVRETRPELEALLRPGKPHDDMSFEDLENSYNFLLNSHVRTVFALLIVKEVEQIRRKTGGPVRVLDIGCGKGLGLMIKQTEAIATRIDDFWGIEPDTSVCPKDGVFDHFQHALMETAELPEGSFDLAYSFMVMEHVAEPDAFLKAVARCLKPGGVYLFMTPNGLHYFTLTAKLLRRLKLDEFTLRLLKRGAEEEYHYPVQYKFNSERKVRSLAERAEFLEARFAYLEPVGPRGYMKGPLILAFHALRAKRRLIKQKRALLTMVGRLVRSSG